MLAKGHIGTKRVHSRVGVAGNVRHRRSLPGIRTDMYINP